VKIGEAESFRSGWQSLLASLGTGIEESSATGAGPARSGKSFEDASAETLGSASATYSLLAGGKALSWKAGTSQVDPSKTNHRTAAPEEGRTDIPASQPVSGAPRQTATAAKETAIKGQKESASDTQRTAAGKSVKTLASAPMKRPESSEPAQTALLVAVSSAQALRVTESSASQGRSAMDTTDFAGRQKLDGLKTQGLADSAPSPFTSQRLSGTGLTGIRPAQVAAVKEPAGGQAVIGSTKNGTLEVKASQDDLVKGSELPASSETEPVPGVEPPSASTVAPALSGKETETVRQAQDSVANPATGEGVVRPVLASGSAGAQSSQFHAPLSVASNSGSLSGEPASTSASARPGHAGGNHATIQPVNCLSATQPVAGAQDSANPILVRDLGGARETAGTTGNLAHGSNAPATGPGTGDTFAALDTETTSRTSTWIHADAHRAEAGFQDPALGWVSVRADVGAGGIHASLVPASADAAQALGGHLAGLSAHLTEQHTPVETLTLAAPEGRGLDAGMDRNANQGMDQGAGHGSQARQQSGTEAEAATVAPAVPTGVRSPAGEMETILPVARPGDMHISVMA
jgi:hypothetical protein